MDLSLQAVDTSPDGLELRVIMRGKGGCASLLQPANARFDRRLVDPDNVVVLVHLYVQRIAERNHQMLFIHLRIALDRVVLDVFGDLAQLRQGLMSQFVMCVCHMDVT
jgi:hypothetical protein